MNFFPSSRLINWLLFFCWDLPRVLVDSVRVRIGQRAAEREARTRAGGGR